jgi:FKBP-type peptidyl-prolyl cis-trans isomerase FkpA
MRIVLCILASLVFVFACSDAEDAGGSAPGSDVAASGGLEITHLREGSGPSPSANDVVQVHYHGTFPDGRVFDSSVERGEPASFPLNRVIPCWTQGVQQMKVGGKAKLVCPPALAYGERGAPPTIPPNATLVFEVELLAIQ